MRCWNRCYYQFRAQSFQEYGSRRYGMVGQLGGGSDPRAGPASMRPTDTMCMSFYFILFYFMALVEGRQVYHLVIRANCTVQSSVSTSCNSVRKGANRKGLRRQSYLRQVVLQCSHAQTTQSIPSLHSCPQITSFSPVGVVERVTCALAYAFDCSHIMDALYIN